MLLTMLVMRNFITNIANYKLDRQEESLMQAQELLPIQQTEGDITTNMQTTPLKITPN